MSDINKTIAKDYDVLLEKEGVALRGTFIIDPNGILRQMTVNDLPIGRSIDEALRIIEALRFNEEHGEGITIYTLYRLSQNNTYKARPYILKINSIRLVKKKI